MVCYERTSSSTEYILKSLYVHVLYTKHGIGKGQTFAFIFGILQPFVWWKCDWKFCLYTKINLLISDWKWKQHLFQFLTDQYHRMEN